MIFYNECNCLVEYDILEQAIIEECKRRKITPKNEYKIFMYRGYAGISLKHEKVSIHRIIGKYMVGVDLHSDICVHHIDRNKLNNKVGNLQIMKSSLHTKEHYLVQYVEKEKLRKNALLGAEKVKRKDILKEDVLELKRQGFTYKEIAKKLNCGYNTIWRRLKS